MEHGERPTAPYWSPATVAAPPPVGSSPPGLVAGGSWSPLLPRPARRYEYPATAHSPLPYLLAYLGLLVVGFGLLVSSGVLAASHDDERWPFLAVCGALTLCAGGLLAYAWIRRIGRNAEAFGLPLLLLASLPWGWFALSVGGETTSVEGAMARLALAILLTLAFGVLVRRTFVLRLWDACGLGYGRFAALLWLPDLVAELVLLVTVFAHVASARTETTSNGYYRYTRTTIEPVSPTLVVGVALVAGAVGVAFFVVLIVGTARQHVAIGRDRAQRAEEAALAAAARAVPGS